MARAIPERVYCLARCCDGRWLLLNRAYKPYGVQWPRERWADYDACDGTRVWLREPDLQRLDGGSTPYRPSDRMVWLFHDGTNPRLSTAHHPRYQRRLALLALGEATQP